MSELENKSGANDGVSSVVKELEGRRNKAHSQEEMPEQRHLRPRAPPVPSVTEENKIVSEDTVIVDAKERKEVDYVSSEKTKYNLAKNLSSTTKRRDSPEAVKKKSPESILLASVEVERKGTSSLQPIPSDVKSVTPDSVKQPKKSVMENIHDVDDDKIMEDTVKMRTSELPTKHSEWTSISDMKKQKTSGDWNDECIQNTKSNSSEEEVKHWELERKASIGPRWTRTPNSCASGILINVPRAIKKIPRNKSVPTTTMSGITITVSKVDLDVPYVKLLGAFRDHFYLVRGKFKECSKYLNLRF